MHSSTDTVPTRRELVLRSYKLNRRSRKNTKSISATAYNLIRNIHQGMPVYDVSDVRLGMVARVCFPSDIKQPLVGHAPLIPPLETMPTILAARLRREGYLEIDSGLLSGNYYVVPHQIADVTYHAVYLFVNRNGLFRA